MSEIIGVVRKVDGSPVVDAVIMIADGPRHPDMALLTDMEGRYRLDRLLAGTYTLLVNAESHQAQTGQITVQQDEIGGLDFVLQ